MKNNKNVSILNLKRNPIKAVLYNDAGDNVVVVYDQNEIKRILEEGKIENPVIVYNPDTETQKEIKTIILSNIDGINDENNKIDIEITGENFLRDILGMVTNIDLELQEDTEENKQLIKDILDDPSEILKKVHGITLDIFKIIADEINETFQNYSKMSKEQLDMITEMNQKDKAETIQIEEVIEEVAEETEEEKLIREFEERLAEIKNRKARI